MLQNKIPRGLNRGLFYGDKKHNFRATARPTWKEGDRFVKTAF
jgi:hypothetical protein